MGSKAAGDDILARIMARKRVEVAALRPRAEAERWRERAERLAPPPDFFKAVTEPGRIRVIAEMKRRSPSAGVLRDPFDPPAIARSYQSGGAAAMSVLTDHDFFGGGIDDLATVRESVAIPLLRKDFILDPIQIHEARLAGAAACLLIAECLTPSDLIELSALIRALSMTPLIELHDATNLDAVLACEGALVGINNRDLRTFKTDISHTLDLLPRIPRERKVVSESGIHEREHVRRLEAAGVAAILVGEAFMRAPDPGARLRELLDG